MTNTTNSAKGLKEFNKFANIINTTRNATSAKTGGERSMGLINIIKGLMTGN